MRASGLVPAFQVSSESTRLEGKPDVIRDRLDDVLRGLLLLACVAGVGGFSFEHPV